MRTTVDVINKHLKRFDEVLPVKTGPNSSLKFANSSASAHRVSQPRESIIDLVASSEFIFDQWLIIFKMFFDNKDTSFVGIGAFKTEITRTDLVI